MGIDSHGGRNIGRGVGRGVGLNVGLNIDGGGKKVRYGEFPSPLPYIGSKWSRTDFGS